MTTNAVVERRFEHLPIVGESGLWRDVLRKARLGLSRTQLYTRMRKHGLVEATANS